jgi:hypothetical protein
MTALELVAVDIETTGFTVSDTVTVVGFAVPMGVRVFVRVHEPGGEPHAGSAAPPGEESATDTDAIVTASALEDNVATALDDDQGVTVSTHTSERALLGAVQSFVADRLAGRDVLIVAYNGETWKAGFDLPFLRTRHAQLDVPWPFRDVPYADLLPVIRKRFNTTQDDGEGQADLVTAYDTLCAGPYTELDPFEDSAAAVTAFEDGEYGELVLHNVADILRTRALGVLAQRYCSKSDFSLKSLTPTIHD